MEYGVTASTDGGEGNQPFFSITALAAVTSIIPNAKCAGGCSAHLLRRLHGEMNDIFANRYKTLENGQLDNTLIVYL